MVGSPFHSRYRGLRRDETLPIESCYTQPVIGAPMDDIKEQLKVLILKSLRITDVSPLDLSDDQLLMGGDLEIDSIDVLQLILEIERHFGIKLEKGGKFEKTEWSSIRTLATAIEARLVEVVDGKSG